MNKNETQIVKGIAILFMIFGHLFYIPDNVQLCTNYIYIGEMPLVQWLTGAMNPVAFFLILSGYGMHCIHSKGGIDNHRWTRIAKILLHWWIILVLITVPCFIFRGLYYNDSYSIIFNYSTFDTSWYGEAWFLFPFMCLSLLSPVIFNITDRIRTRWVLIISFLIGTSTSFIISRYGVQYLYGNNFLYNPFLIIHLSPAFIWGGQLHRLHIIETLKNKQLGIKLYIPLVAFFVLMCITRTAAWGPLYATTFIVLFLSCPRWIVIDKLLGYLGKHSMNMWLIHAWICYYIFHDELYSLKYPLLIMVVVIIVSLLGSYLVDIIYYCLSCIFRKALLLCKK